MQKVRRRALVADRVKQGSPAYVVIVDKFGGLTNFCNATHIKLSTAYHWLRSGLIPAKWHSPGRSYQRFIIEVGSQHGIRIDPADFIEDATYAE